MTMMDNLAGQRAQSFFMTDACFKDEYSMFFVAANLVDYRGINALMLIFYLEYFARCPQ